MIKQHSLIRTVHLECGEPWGGTWASILLQSWHPIAFVSTPPPSTDPTQTSRTDSRRYETIHINTPAGCLAPPERRGQHARCQKCVMKPRRQISGLPLGSTSETESIRSLPEPKRKHWKRTMSHWFSLVASLCCRASFSAIKRWQVCTAPLRHNNSLFLSTIRELHNDTLS